MRGCTTCWAICRALLVFHDCPDTDSWLEPARGVALPARDGGAEEIKGTPRIETIVNESDQRAYSSSPDPTISCRFWRCTSEAQEEDWADDWAESWSYM